MAKGEYAVVDGTTRKIKKKYAVVDGVTRKIKKEYVIVDGKTRLCWNGGATWLTTWCANYANSFGFVTSEDNGETWNVSTSELTKTEFIQYGKLVVHNGKFYAVSSVSNKITLWASSDGHTWECVSTTIPSVKLYSFNNTLICFSKLTVYYSKDNGVTWTSFAVPGETYQNSIQDIVYGTINGDTEAKFYIFSKTTYGNGTSGYNYSHKFHVYNSSFVYENTLDTKLDIDSGGYVGGINITNGYLTFFTQGSNDYGVYYHTYRYVNGYFSQSSSLGSFSTIFPILYTNNKALFFYTQTSSSGLSTYNYMCKYDGTSCTLSTISSIYAGIEGQMDVYEGRIMGVVRGSKTIAYSDDEGSTWTKVTIEANGTLSYSASSYNDPGIRVLE